MDMPRHNPLTILAADPDRGAQQVIVAALQKQYRVFVASNLTEAAQGLAYYQPHILLLELAQPDGDGIEFIRYVHNEPRLNGLIIACVTLRSGTRDKASAFQAGADDYIVKPINPNTFAGRVGLLTRLSRLPTWRNVPPDPDGYNADTVIDYTVDRRPTQKQLR